MERVSEGRVRPAAGDKKGQGRSGSSREGFSNGQTWAEGGRQQRRLGQRADWGGRRTAAGAPPAP